MGGILTILIFVLVIAGLNRFEFGRFTRFVLGSRVVAGFFATKAVECEHCAVARHVFGPARQGARRAVPHPAETAHVAVHQHGGLVGDEVERIMHQMPVQQRNGRGPRTLRRLL